MLQNYYLQEKLAEFHRKDLLREAEQRLLASHIPPRSHSLPRRSAEKVGKLFVMLGASLKRPGPSSENVLQKL